MCSHVAIDAIKELNKRGAPSFITVVAGLKSHEVVCKFKSLREAQLFHRALIQCGEAASCVKRELEELLAALDALEFCEGALVDHFAGEDGLEPEAARRIAWMVSEVLRKAGRHSVLDEASQQPST